MGESCSTRDAARLALLLTACFFFFFPFSQQRLSLQQLPRPAAVAQQPLKALLCASLRSAGLQLGTPPRRATIGATGAAARLRALRPQA